MEDLIEDALLNDDYRLLTDLESLDSVERSQLIINNPIEFIKYCPISSPGIRMFVYEILEDIYFEEDVDYLLKILYEMKDENLIKLFDKELFTVNFREATTMNFNEVTVRKVDSFLQYVDDKRREYNV